MARDEALLRALAPQELFVHLYEWQGDCATYGHFVDPSHYIALDATERLGLQIARRPTGGGVLFHSYDCAFSVLIGRESSAYRSNTLEGYELLNHWVGGIVEGIFGVCPAITPKGQCGKSPMLERFCMARPTKYDLVVQGRKVGGAAQRRSKQGLLHQGTICLALPPKEYLEQVLIQGSALSAAMYANSFPLIGAVASQREMAEACKAIRHAIISSSKGSKTSKRS